MEKKETKRAYQTPKMEVANVLLRRSMLSDSRDFDSTDRSDDSQKSTEKYTHQSTKSWF